MSPYISVADASVQLQVESKIRMSTGEVLALVDKIQRRPQIYRTTGAVDSATLCELADILAFTEDIGRHNAVDKVFGECILNDIPTDDRIVIPRGRTCFEILLKVAGRNVR